MMTSINPKNTNINNNINSNEGNNIIPSISNNLFQRNNYGIEKEGNNEGILNNIKFKTNSNINFNMNDKNYNSPQINNFTNLSKTEKNNENALKNINFDYGKINTNNNISNISNNLNNLNLNYNNQNNSINLNLGLGLQAKKNYSTPILNEKIQEKSQDRNYNKSFDMFERNQQNKNMSNLGQEQDLNQNKNAGNDNYYLSQIEKLKLEINKLKNSNEYLNNQLKEEQRKNEQLLSIQKVKDEGENSILSEICHSLQVSSFDEILPKLNEIINYLNNNVNNNSNKNKNQDNNNKIRDELISKLQNLYLSLTGSNEKKEEITIKILWRWIKHLINTVKQLALEKEKNIEIYQNMQEIDDYKEYCEELISSFNLQSLDELKMFIDNLLKQNNIIKESENQQEIRNMPMGGQPQNAPQQQFQMQNYQQEEENDDGEEEQGVEGEGEGEGEEEGDENENIDPNDPNQQQYDNENEYDENNENEIMQQQMALNNQNNPNEGNYNFKYEGNENQGMNIKLY